MDVGLGYLRKDADDLVRWTDRCMFEQPVAAGLALLGEGPKQNAVARVAFAPLITRR